MAPPMPPDASKEIEFIRGLVAKRFPVYDVRVTYDVVEFFVRTDNETLDQSFEELRTEMAQHNYIPMIVYDKGEHIITVAKKPVVKYRSSRVNLVMLLLTILTTSIAGTLEWAGYQNLPGRDTFAPSTILMGTLTFALPLMAILAVHELSHYFAARRRNVAQSLPFFIPFLPPVGTMGAVISMRDPIPNKKTLLEIGVAGPLAGFLLTIPIGIAGMILTNDAAKLAPTNVPSGGNLAVVFPLMYRALEYFVPINGNYLMHPTLFAAWVGFFVTAINLLPAGQLDGGHVARALLGSNSRYLGWGVIGLLVALGLTDAYLGWLVYAVFILFLGVRHPPPLNDMTKLDFKRKAVGIATFVVLIVAFVPTPFIITSPTYSFEMTNHGSSNVTIAPGESHTFSILVNNTGNAFNEIELGVDSSHYGWSIAFKEHRLNDTAYANKFTVGLNSSQNVTVDVNILSPATAPFGTNSSVTIKGISQNSTSTVKTLTYNLTIVSPAFTFWVENDGPSVAPGRWGNISVHVNNTGAVESNVTLSANGTMPTFVTAMLVVGSINSTGPVDITVPGHGSAVFTVMVYVSPPATAGVKIIHVDTQYHGAELQLLAIHIDVP